MLQTFEKDFSKVSVVFIMGIGMLFQDFISISFSRKEEGNSKWGLYSNFW